MLAAINLDNQPALETDKIDNVSIHRHLPLELHAFELTAPKRLPKHVFSLGGVRPHLLREIAVP